VIFNVTFAHVVDTAQLLIVNISKLKEDDNLDINVSELPLLINAVDQNIAVQLKIQAM
jgi:hypothetical protein